jgi:putative hemolysin
MIRNIFEFGDTPVQEIMTPRMSIVSVPLSATLEQVSQVINEEKHTRIPVHDSDLDHVVGFIHSKDILKWLTEHEDENFSVQKVLRKAYLVPNQKPIDELLREFRAERSHLAIVVDEYGNTVGLVSMEDILEEIVGEIYDEDDDPDLDLEQVGHNRWMVDPSISLADLEEAIGVEIPLDEDEEADSLGGLIVLKFGRVPGKGQKIDIGPARVRIVRASAQRLLRVLVELKTFNTHRHVEK